MAKSEYLTAPLKTDRMPPGVPFIVGNEAAERFSYYGMNSILVIFMTRYLLNSRGQPDPMSGAQADAWYHTFVSTLFFLPIIGAVLGDAIIGKFRTILSLSIVYCLGDRSHAAGLGDRSGADRSWRRWNQAMRQRERGRSVRCHQSAFTDSRL